MECPCGGDDIELRTEGYCCDITWLKLQVRKHGLFPSCDFEKRLIAVDAHYASLWPDSLCDTRGNRTAAAAGIHHRKPGPQQFGKATVVPLKGSSLQNARIRPV